MRSIFLWLGMVIITILGVTIDLYTTHIGLSMGFVELNPFGNLPFIYYPWMIAMVSLVFWYGNTILSTQKEPFKSKFNKMYLGASVFVCMLPFIAVLWNVIQIYA